MKILHVSSLYYPVVGGAQSHLKELSEGLVARGHEVTVMTANVSSMWDLRANKPGLLSKRETVNGVKVIRLDPEGQFLGPALRRLIELKGGHRALSSVLTPDGCNLLLEPPRMFSVIPHIIRSNADIVTSIGWGHPSCYHVYLARLLKKFTVVGIPLFHTAATWPHRPIYRKLLGQCDAVIVNTAHEGEFVSTHSGKRVAVCGVGIHPEAFASRDGQAMRARYGLGNAPVVGFVGRQDSSKGADVLILAMRVVWKWNADARLVLAGNCPTRPDSLDDLLRTFSASERRQILRIERFPDEEKASLYEAFDVVALPSTEESFGIAFLEAWMCKKPVIGSRIGSTQCVIQDGVDGLLVDHRDHYDLGQKIVELLSNPAQRIQMGSHGHQKTLDRFTWAKVVDRVERVFLEFASPKEIR